MSSLSKGEIILCSWLEENNISYQREVPFSPYHKYRYDFVLLDKNLEPRLAVEVDGGPFPKSGQGHMSFKQYMSDKYRDNISVFMGWSRVMRIPSLWLYQPYARSTETFKRMNKSEIISIFFKCLES